LKWIFERTDNTNNANQSAIGYIPKPGALDTKGLKVSDSDMSELFRIDKNEWMGDVASLRKYFSSFGNRLPERITKELNDLETRLQKS
jgi:phosphoenolpyruvate carboxykinase (GTP)